MDPELRNEMKETQSMNSNLETTDELMRIFKRGPGWRLLVGLAAISVLVLAIYLITPLWKTYRYRNAVSAALPRISEALSELETCAIGAEIDLADWLPHIMHDMAITPNAPLLVMHENCVPDFQTSVMAALEEIPRAPDGMSLESLVEAVEFFSNTATQSFRSHDSAASRCGDLNLLNEIHRALARALGETVHDQYAINCDDLVFIPDILETPELTAVPFPEPMRTVSGNFPEQQWPRDEYEFVHFDLSWLLDRNDEHIADVFYRTDNTKTWEELVLPTSRRGDDWSCDWVDDSAVCFVRCCSDVNHCSDRCTVGNSSGLFPSQFQLLSLQNGQWEPGDPFDLGVYPSHLAISRSNDVVVAVRSSDEVYYMRANLLGRNLERIAGHPRVDEELSPSRNEFVWRGIRWFWIGGEQEFTHFRTGCRVDSEEPTSADTLSADLYHLTSENDLVVSSFEFPQTGELCPTYVARCATESTRWMLLANRFLLVERGNGVWEEHSSFEPLQPWGTELICVDEDLFVTGWVANDTSESRRRTPVAVRRCSSQGGCSEPIIPTERPVAQFGVGLVSDRVDLVLDLVPEPNNPIECALFEVPLEGTTAELSGVFRCFFNQSHEAYRRNDTWFRLR